LDDNSKLNMQGIMIIGQNAPSLFPPPNAEFTKLSNEEIHKEAQNIIGKLLAFERDYERHLVDSTWKSNKTMAERQAKMDHNKLVLQRFAEKYQRDPLSTAALSLVS